MLNMDRAVTAAPTQSFNNVIPFPNSRIVSPSARVAATGSGEAPLSTATMVRLALFLDGLSSAESEFCFGFLDVRINK